MHIPMCKPKQFQETRRTWPSATCTPGLTKDAWLASVLFTSTVKSAFCIFKTTKSISTQFIYFCLTYTLLHISKLKEIAVVFLEIFVPKNCPIFLLLCTKLQNWRNARTLKLYATTPSNTYIAGHNGI